MAEMVDYAFSKPSVPGLVAAGKDGAGRYIGPGSAGKHLTAAEAVALHTAGMCIWLSVEGNGNDALQGRTLGTAHGAQAVTAARALGVPAGVALFGNIDFDVSAAQWPTAAGYMAGFAGPVRAAGYRVGQYGGLNATEWGARDHTADLYWQTFAWSTRNGSVVWSGHAALQQYHNGVALAGGIVDLNRSMIADFGQWVRGGVAPPPQPEESDMRMIVDPSSSVYLLNGQVDPVTGWPVLIPISVTARYEAYRDAGIAVTTQAELVNWAYYTRGPVPADPSSITPEDLAAITAAAHQGGQDGAAAAINGATIHAAP